MLLNPNFEQNKYSLTSNGIYKIGHGSTRLMKWICYYDRSFYDNINYYDMMGSICIFLKNILLEEFKNYIDYIKGQEASILEKFLNK